MAEESEVVGDSSRDILRNIQHAAKELMRTVLQCRVNAKEVEDPNTRNTELSLLVALQREKESLIRDQVNCTAELELPTAVPVITNQIVLSVLPWRLIIEGSTLLQSRWRTQVSVQIKTHWMSFGKGVRLPSHSLLGDSDSHIIHFYQTCLLGVNDVKVLIYSGAPWIQELEGELQSVRGQHYRDRQLLECLQRSERLSKQLFPSHTTPSSNEEQLCSMVECQAGLVRELLRNLEEDGELSSEITALQGQRGEAQRSCRKHTNKLETLQHQQATSVSEAPQAQRLQLQLGRLSHEATLLRHTLQGLIVGSGVDWAGQGEELQELMLQLGSPFHWQ